MDPDDPVDRDRTQDTDERDKLAPRGTTFRSAVRDEDPGRWGPRKDPARVGGAMWADDTMRPSEPMRTATYEPTPPITRDVERPAYTDPTARRPAIDETGPPVGARRFSIAATFLGWAVAAFFTLMFAGVTLALLGTSLTDGRLDLGAFETSSLVGYILASFLAYVIGGYAAGRIALWNGMWHGMATVAWAVLFALLGFAAGTAVADLADVSARLGVDLTDVTTASAIAIALSLIAMLAGGALGGRLGERYHEARAGTTTGGMRRYRGRPL